MGILLKRYLKIIKPVSLLLALLTYLLGAASTNYLGSIIEAIVFFMGLIIIEVLFLGMFSLSGFFQLAFKPLMEGETPRQRLRLRAILFNSSIGLMSILVIAAFLLKIQYELNIPALLLIVLLIALALFFSIPPFKLIGSGFGELILAFMIGSLVPLFSHVLLSGTIHRLIAFMSFPVVLILISSQIIQNFNSFSLDIKTETNSLVTRLGIKQAGWLHNIFLLLAYLFLALGPLVSVPWRLIFPLFISLPVACLQIIWLQKILQGGRALWDRLVALSAVTVGSLTYLMVVSLWSN
ncbi:MAG: hypothetical protein LUP94_01770 [Candidatus Methanomethylicus sp.]|nr:hypothetical protein [Candidatus Methanomethylicus sp.]